MSASADFIDLHPELVDVHHALASLDKYDLAVLEWRLRWQKQARAKQLAPPGKWNTWGIMSGRGFGKTLTGANWLGIEAALQPGSFNGMIGPTGDDVRAVMIEGPTGLLNAIPPLLVDDYNVTLHKLTLWNGSTIRGFSAEEPRRLRGPQHHNVWADEVAAWTDGVDTWDMMKFGLRLGVHPKVLWTSTPKYVELVRKLLRDKKAVVVRGTTYENRDNLSDSFYDELRQYEGTKLGRQELDGELIDPEEDGIVERSQWQLWPADAPLPRFRFILMSLDTAFTEKAMNKKTKEPDYTACQVWGLWDHDGHPNMLLLDAWRDHLGFPQLVERVKKERAFTYGDSDEPLIKTYLGRNSAGHQGRQPDLILIEDKGSGISLRQQLAVEDIIATPYNPGKMDKLSRLHAVSPLFAAKRVWAVESDRHPGRPRSWADPVITAVCSFHGAGSIRHDDEVDVCTQALRWFKDNYFGALSEKGPPVYREDVVEDLDIRNPYAQ